MKLRKITALCAALAVVLALCAPVFAASGDLVYEMDAAEIEKFLSKATDKNTDFLIQAGSPTISKDGNGVALTNRKEYYDAFDIKTSEFMKAGVKYTVLVGVRGLGTDVNVQLWQGKGPYEKLADPVSVKAGAKQTLKLVIADGAPFEKQSIRIGTAQDDSVTKDYAVDTILVYEGDPPSGGGGGGGEANPATGSSPVVYYALTVAVLGFVLSAVFSRKARAK